MKYCPHLQDEPISKAEICGGHAMVRGGCGSDKLKFPLT